MTTNTNAALVANNLIAVAEDQAFEAWYKQDCLVGGVNARIAARAAWNARAALTTAAAVPAMTRQQVIDRFGFLEGIVNEANFMRIVDEACTLAAAPKAEPVPAGEYPRLPAPDFGRSRRLGAAYYGDAYTADQMRAYVDADRAMRAQAAPQPAAPARNDDEHPAAKRMREQFEAEYGQNHPIASAIRRYYSTHKEYDEAWNRDREKPVTLEDVNAAEAGVFAAAALVYAPQPAVQQGADFAELQRLADCCPELNERNYDQGDVEELNAWAIEVAQCIDRALAAHPAAPVAQGDADFEAVRKKLCALQRYSFVLDDDGVVRRVQDRTGNWIEFDDAHELFDPVAVDAAIAAQAKEGA